MKNDHRIFPELSRPHPNLVFYEILRVLLLSMILPEHITIRYSIEGWFLD
jgi:hypothetical protein